MTIDSTALIRALNDKLRQHLTGGRIVATRGVMARGSFFLGLALEATKAFDAFDPDNDPWDEHDFGAVEIGDARVFWRIDYYNETLIGGAENPTDQAGCIRVLTMMLAEEY